MPADALKYWSPKNDNEDTDAGDAPAETPIAVDEEGEDAQQPALEGPQGVDVAAHGQGLGISTDLVDDLLVSELHWGLAPLHQKMHRIDTSIV